MFPVAVPLPVTGVAGAASALTVGAVGNSTPPVSKARLQAEATAFVSQLAEQVRPQLVTAKQLLGLERPDAASAMVAIAEIARRASASLFWVADPPASNGHESFPAQTVVSGVPPSQADESVARMLPGGFVATKDGEIAPMSGSLPARAPALSTELLPASDVPKAGAMMNAAAAAESARTEGSAKPASEFDRLLERQVSREGGREHAVEVDPESQGSDLEVLLAKPTRSDFGATRSTSIEETPSAESQSPRRLLRFNAEASLERSTSTYGNWSTTTRCCR